MNKWYRLDNAAKVFPSVTSKRNSSVFRFAAILTQPVDPQALQQAVDKVMPRYPMFAVRMRKGIFWNYFDDNTQSVLVEEEVSSPCRRFNTIQDRGYLIRVLYGGHRLSLEMFHALTDGSGAIEFFKSILFYYFEATGATIEPEGKIKLCHEAPSDKEVEDSFAKYYNPIYSEQTRNPRSFHIRGVAYDDERNSAIHGQLNGQALNQVAKKYGGSITAYLAALLLICIYQSRSQQRNLKKPIVIAVPVNLRKAFPSETLRNFFNVVNVGAYMDETMTLEKLVPLMQEMLLQKTNPTYLQSSINNNVKFERHIASKFVPLFVKNFFVRLGFDHLSDSKKTITLTNLGQVALPAGMDELVEQLEILAYPTQKSPMACGVMSYNNRLTINFIKNIIETDIIQAFFSHLATVEGLEVEVYSNQLEQTFSKKADFS